jgi:hypothetical protein
MSDDVIRSTKGHEVVIPEGSINAKSKTSTVGVTEIEPEHVEKVSETHAIVDRRVSVDDSHASGSGNVPLPEDKGRADNRVLIPQTQTSENRVQLPQDSIDDNRIPVISDVLQDGPRVTLPSDGSVLRDPELNPIEENKATPLSSDEVENHLPEEFPTASQVAASLADKRRQEFVGRVVKLREEVDHLNQRLDHLEK